MLLPISELYTTMQGEGPHIGKPVVMVRFSGCNLRCKWGDVLCDTPYASWYPEQSKRELAKVEEEIFSLLKPEMRVIFTGGEPTIIKGFDKLCKALHLKNIIIDVETNGLGQVPKEISTIVCSPKLSDSIPLGTKYEAMHSKRYKELHEDINGKDERLYLKFVIGPNTSFSEVKECVERCQCPSKRVYCMPLACTKDELEKNSVRAATFAKEQGYCFSDRLHIRLWGQERGR